MVILVFLANAQASKVEAESGIVKALSTPPHDRVLRVRVSSPGRRGSTVCLQLNLCIPASTPDYVHHRRLCRAGCAQNAHALSYNNNHDQPVRYHSHTRPISHHLVAAES